MSNTVSVSSTTDDLAKVRAAAGLPEELTEEEKTEQREAEELQMQRRENGHRDPEQSPNGRNGRGRRGMFLSGGIRCD